jgi:hypothetical protein
MDEDQIVFSPQSGEDAGEVTQGEEVLLSSFIDHKAFCG